MDKLTSSKTVLFLGLAVALLISVAALIDERILRALANAAGPAGEVLATQVAWFVAPPVFAAVSFGWLIVVRLALIAWMRAAYAFAREDLDVRDFYHRGWTFWGWFVPILSLYKPCQVLQEIYRSGDPSAGERPLEDIDSSTSLLLWWIVQRLLHAVYIVSILVFALYALTSVFLSPLSTPGVQVKLTAAVYALMAAGWLLVVGSLSARLRHHARQEEESDHDEAFRRDEAPDVEQEDGGERSNPYVGITYRREPLIGDLPAETEKEAAGPAGGATVLSTPVRQPKHSIVSDGVGTFVSPTVVAERPSEVQHPDASEFDESAAYATIAEELESGQRDKGTWLRAVVESGGDTARQPTLYAMLRLKQLRIAHQKELMSLAERQRLEEEERVEKERAAERRREAERYLMEDFHHRDAVTLDGPKFLEVVRVAAEENRVNQRSRSNGKTLLHMAVERLAFHSRQAEDEQSHAEPLAYDRQAIRLLLDAGADPALRDRGSRSAHDYARAIGVPLRQMG